MTKLTSCPQFCPHQMPPYHDRPYFPSLHGQGEPVDFYRQHFNARNLRFLPGILLNFHHEVFGVVIAAAALSEDVGTGTRDVKRRPVEG